MMVYFVSEQPRCQDRQHPERDADSKRLMEEKLQKVVNRGYLDNDQVVVSLTSFFSVPKGDSDIRMVYDGTKCGLNGSVWVPRFYMPTLTSHLRTVVEGTYMCDVDIGEMFLNFMLHPTLRTLCGVDLSNYKVDLTSLEVPTDPEAAKTWLSWNRIAMGLKWSPTRLSKACTSQRKSSEVTEQISRASSSGTRFDSTTQVRTTTIRLCLGSPR